MKTFSFHHRASALLLSFFMMSMLVMVGLAVSVLVIHDVRASRTELAGAQASYAAEGMSELGLQLMKDNLPGYEPDVPPGDLGVDMASLTVDALSTSGTMPCEGQNDADDGWRKLTQNESIQIPLFAQTDEAGSVYDFPNFSVDFYVPGTPAPTTDVLRWKILGMRASRTEAISEYIPLIDSSQNSPEYSSSFGPDSPALANGYKSGKYYQLSTYPHVTNPTYPITEFLADHSFSYLVLTNVVTRDTDNDLYIRYHGNENEAVCEYTQLNSLAEVTSAEVRQELVTLVKEGQNLPVFDFVIYHTGKQTPSISPSVFSPASPHFGP